MDTCHIVEPNTDMLSAIQRSLDFSEELKHNRGNTPANQAFLAAFADKAEQAMEALLPKPKPFHLGWVNVCRMVQAAMPLTSERERTEGMPLWRWAALASFRFRPSPVERAFRVEHGIMYHHITLPKRDGSGLGFVPGKEPGRYGQLAYAAGSNMPRHSQEPVGAKILDHTGAVLACVGACERLSTDTVSNFVMGISEAPEMDAGWVYRNRGRPERIITELGRMALAQRDSL